MSKASNLTLLKTFATGFVVDDFVSFTVAVWKRSRRRTLQRIAEAGLAELVVVRSSAVQEDSASSSMAGMFHSEKNVRSADPAALEAAIEAVIASYAARGSSNGRDEVIVQTQMLHSAWAGVLMTRDPRSGAAYYMIDFDATTGRTDAVTSGLDTNSLRVLRGAAAAAPEPWNYLLAAVQEIELRFGGAPLELEFGLTVSNEVHIFQVRPLVGVAPLGAAHDVQAFRALNQIRAMARQHLGEGRLLDTPPIYSDMADWNPAEMLGHAPSPLAYSLYRELVTRSTWRVSRVSLGYADPGERELMLRLGSHPYIDVQASLCSLMPAGLPSRVRDRVVAGYLRHLRAEPHLHDKVEFAVAQTCLDPASPRRTLGLLRWGVERPDIDALDVALVQLTTQLLKRAPRQNLLDMESCTELRQGSNWREHTGDLPALLGWIREAVLRCRDGGVLPFARLARQAFVGEDLLRRLVVAGALQPEQRDKVLADVPTVAGEMRQMRQAVTMGKVAAEEFLREYGHLRPGSYDIQSPRYDAAPELILGEGAWPALLDREEGAELDVRSHRDMERALQSAGLVLSSVQFLDYVVTSATYRDRAKFMFSSLLSDILEAIACAGSLMGLGRAEMALLRIEQIVGSRGNDAVVRRPGYWQELVEQSRRLEAGHEGLVFPAVLMHEDDLLYVPAGATSPNFVTSGVVQAPVVQLDGRLHSVGTDIDGCIAMVEAADPGYDWMFSRGISGLITRYGGMASHMAIRCHEMRIPAVIGCGDTMYEKLQRARVVRIDAGSRTVQIVESR
jgi:hypothetical protein